MKRLLLFALLFAVCLPVSSQTAPTPGASPTAPQGRKKRVAILDFDYGTVHSGVAALFGSDIDVGKGITDLLVKYLVKDGTYSVIERKALDKVLAEQNFSNSDRANPTSAAKLGKLLGVDAIIVGSITQFGGETKNTNVGGAGAGLGKLGFGGFGQKKTKAVVAIDARIVDIDTAEILGVADGKAESQRQSTSLLGGGGGWSGFGAGGVDFGSSNFQETIIGEAVTKATEQLSTGLVANNSRLQARVISVEGLIAAVEGGDIILNVGGKNGVQNGMQLTVERTTKEIKDPATGKVLRRLSSQVGVLQVTDVDDVSAIAKIVSGSGFKVGDVVKTTAQ
ncbi:MAG TPA: CsgG/HfaB family protein [Terriglobales bacterium]|nr:CsgG/HfaB family protein [Terriglobales bacterium]